MTVPRMEINLERTFPLNTHEGVRVLRFSEIVCCEYTRHMVIYSLSDGTSVSSKIFKGSFPQYVSRLLEDRRFLRPHVSYVLNMDHVVRFNKNNFTLRYGCSVPIVARKYCAVRDIYMDYLLSKERSR